MLRVGFVVQCYQPVHTAGMPRTGCLYGASCVSMVTVWPANLHLLKQHCGRFLPLGSVGCSGSWERCATDQAIHDNQTLPLKIFNMFSVSGYVLSVCDDCAKEEPRVQSDEFNAF